MEGIFLQWVTPTVPPPVSLSRLNFNTSGSPLEVSSWDTSSEHVGLRFWSRLPGPLVLLLHGPSVHLGCRDRSNRNTEACFPRLNQRNRVCFLQGGTHRKAHTPRAGSQLSFVLRQIWALLKLEKYGNEGDHEHAALCEECRE